MRRTLYLYYVYAALSSLTFSWTTWFAFVAARGGNPGWAESAFHIAILMGEVPTGVVADLLGRRRSMLIGLLLSALSLFSYPLISDTLTACLVLGVSGLSLTFLSGAETALLYEAASAIGGEDLARRSLARASALQMVSLAAAPAAAGWLYQRHPLAPFLAQGLLTLLAAVAVWRMIEPRTEQESDAQPKRQSERESSARSERQSDLQPEQPSGTQPEQSSGTQPEQSSGTQPEQSSGTQPEWQSNPPLEREPSSKPDSATARRSGPGTAPDPEPPTTSGPGAGRQSPWHHARMAVGLLRRRPALLGMIVFSWVYGAAGSMVNQFAQVYLPALGLTMLGTGMVFSIGRLLGAVGGWLAGRMTGVSVTRWLRWGPLAQAAFVLAMGTARTLTGVAGLALNEGIDGLVYPLLSARINQVIPSEQRATILSFQSLGASLLVAIAFPAAATLPAVERVYLLTGGVLAAAALKWALRRASSSGATESR